MTRLAERARAEAWSHEEFLPACLQREIAARDAHGGEGRVRAARFPARKSLEDFDYDHARGLRREAITHLATLDFVTARENVIFLRRRPGEWLGAEVAAFMSTAPTSGRSANRRSRPPRPAVR